MNCRPTTAGVGEILTWNGVVMDPFEPSPEHICIEDIAHALSLMVRANGHISHFYSVAQHCLNCVSEAECRGDGKDIALLCLLHDAAECYISDLTRPVKNKLLLYRQAELKLIDVIFNKLAGFKPTDEQLARVGAIDDCLLHHEFRLLRGVQLPNPAAAPSARCSVESE